MRRVLLAFGQHRLPADPAREGRVGHANAGTRPRVADQVELDAGRRQAALPGPVRDRPR
jgi:hypothetical protein